MFYAPPIVASGVIRMGITTMIVATLFGGIHCTGWNFPFPSQAELIIWRVSSLIIVIVPCIFLPLLVTAFMKDNPAITDIINMVYVAIMPCLEPPKKIQKFKNSKIQQLKRKILV